MVALPSFLFFFPAPSPSDISPLSLHDALPIFCADPLRWRMAYPLRALYVFVEMTHKGHAAGRPSDRKSTRLNSSHLGISYAVFCLKKKKKKTKKKRPLQKNTTNTTNTQHKQSR